MPTRTYSDHELERIEENIDEYFNIITLNDTIKLLSKIDWLVWEEPNTAHLYTEVDVVPIPEKLWNVIIFNTTDMISLKVPISRYGENKTFIKMFGPITLKKFIKKIHKFYKIELIKEDFKIINDQGDIYYKNAYNNYLKGKKVTYLDLIGIPDIGSDGTFKGPERRHPFSCNGLVRFEGIEIKRHNVYKLVMGS